MDVGDSRIGLAVGDAEGILATPVGFINRTSSDKDISHVLGHALGRGVGAILVGLPISLNGKTGPQARKVGRFIKTLRAGTELPVFTVDERYSTAEAERQLRLAGRQPSRHKGDLDAAAAAVILQGYLDSLPRGNSI